VASKRALKRRLHSALAELNAAHEAGRYSDLLASRNRELAEELAKTRLELEAPRRCPQCGHGHLTPLRNCGVSVGDGTQCTKPAGHGGSHQWTTA
jgi:hypothetical protein